MNPYPTRRLDNHVGIIKRQEDIILDHTIPLLDNYAKNGYLVIPNFTLDQAMIKNFNSSVSTYVNQNLKDNPLIVFEPNSKDIKSLFYVHKLFENVILNILRKKEINTLIRGILGDNIYIHQSRINFKLPGGIGKEFNWHSDFETWHSEDGMPSMRCLTVLIALDEFTKENGAIEFIPQSHKYFIPTKGLTPENNYVSSLSYQTLGVPEKSIIENFKHEYGVHSIQCPPGSAILFDCNTLHFSPANWSQSTRSALFIVLNSLGNQLVHPFESTTHRPYFLAEKENLLLV